MPTMQYAVNADGGFLSVPALSRKIRHFNQQNAILRQFTTVESAFGSKMNSTFYFDRAGNLTPVGSSTGLSEAGSMPEGTVPLTQGSVVVTEYGNASRFTGKVSTLSTISISDVLETSVMNDAKKTVDLVIRTIYRSTDVKIKYATTGTDAAPTSNFDTDGTQSTAWTRKLAVFDVKEVVDYLDGTIYAEPWEDDNYLFIGSVGANRPVFDSTGFQDVAIRQEGGRRIFRGEVGTYYRCRVVKESNSFANTNNSYGGEFVCIGRDAIVEAVAVPLKVIMKKDDDYGRDQGLGWYTIAGWNERWDTSAAGSANIIHGVGT